MRACKMYLRTLRHTCAVHMVKNGVPIYEVSKYLGHESVQTTETHTQSSRQTLCEVVCNRVNAYTGIDSLRKRSDILCARLGVCFAHLESKISVATESHAPSSANAIVFFELTQSWPPKLKAHVRKTSLRFFWIVLPPFEYMQSAMHVATSCSNTCLTRANDTVVPKSFSKLRVTLTIRCPMPNVG